MSEECHTAVDLLVNGASMLGITEGAGQDSIPECSRRLHGWGEGVWYVLQGRQGISKNLTVSTCDENSKVASRASVFRGECGDIQCVDNIITPCETGTQSSITWEAEPNIKYYIYVQGPSTGRRMQSFDFRTPMEYFALRLEDTPTNDNSAIRLLPNGQSTFGSTSSATPDFGCTEGRNKSRGVFYSVVGTGKEMVASTCSKFTDFDSLLSVFADDGNRRCLEKAERNFDCGVKGSSIRWRSIEGETYTILVSGIRFEDFGNFALTIAEENDLCENSMGPLPIDAATVVGTVRRAAAHDVVTCGSQYTWLSGVWFSVVGTGLRLVASASSYGDVYISIHTGRCGALECMMETDSVQSGSRNATKWNSREGELYFILVQANRGPFSLRISQVSNEEVTSFCDDAAEPFELGTLPVRIKSQIFSNNFSEGSSQCGSAVDFGGGAWYSVIGTGGLLHASTCGDFDTQLTIYVGDCSALDCINGNDDIVTKGFPTDALSWQFQDERFNEFEDNFELDVVERVPIQAFPGEFSNRSFLEVPDDCVNDGASEVFWLSERGVGYKVYVHGYAEQYGSYRLTIRSIES